MRIAYLDVFAGISGDMTLGALVDAGVDLDAIREELAKMPLRGWRIEATRARKGSLSGTQVAVMLEDHHPSAGGGGHGGRSCRELVDTIEAADLDSDIIRKSTGILWRIAEAEARIHDTAPEEVHFHELGGIDSLIDIVGAVVGFRLLGVQKIVCSPLPISHGFITCAHGRLPVPAPATAELLRGVPTFPLDVEGETVTPTGAAIAVGLADQVGPFPPMVVEAIGYGCGQADFPIVPNVLRLFVGQRTGAMPGIEGGQGDWPSLVTDRIKLIEANIDDMNPELFGAVVERVFEAGAADAWLTPIHMKKGRPATQLSVLVDAARLEDVVATVLAESTTLGVRISDWERRCLPRHQAAVTTPFGEIHVKIATVGGRVLTVAPEYEDCVQAARNHGVPVKEVYAAALAAARK